MTHGWSIPKAPTKIGSVAELGSRLVHAVPALWVQETSSTFGVVHTYAGVAGGERRKKEKRMRLTIVMVMSGLAFAVPAKAQVPNIQQLLQGLTTGNQGQDQGLRDAFERGYQRGRQDEARLQQNGNRRGTDRREDGNNRDDRRSDQPYDRQDDGSYRNR